MDFFLGIILGVCGVYAYEQIKDVQRQKKLPRRGRPPKKIDVEKKD